MPPRPSKLIIERDDATTPSSPPTPLLARNPSSNAYYFDENTHFSREEELTVRTDFRSFARQDNKTSASPSPTFFSQQGSVIQSPILLSQRDSANKLPRFFLSRQYSASPEAEQLSESKGDIAFALPNQLERQQSIPLTPVQEDEQLPVYYPDIERAKTSILSQLENTSNILASQNKLSPKLAHLFEDAKQLRDIPYLISQLESTLKIKPRPWYLTCFSKPIQHSPQALALFGYILELKNLPLNEETADQFAQNIAALTLAEQWKKHL
ncbi:MAG: hypothetical protein P4M12_03410 [Gammaproteobacteria bacterium]|nr:hypothetical protein [Gammaproteobacteria bacterium]